MPCADFALFPLKITTALSLLGVHQQTSLQRPTMMKNTLRLACILFVCQAGCAWAAVFSNDTVLSPTNSSYDGADIVVSNCVLTVDGVHGFASVRVATGGTLTHSAVTNGVFSIVTSVINEPQTLTGT